MSLRRSILWSFALIVSFAHGQAPDTTAALDRDKASPQITGKIDDTRLVTLEGNVRSAARIALNDRGLVRDDLPLEHMLLVLRRSPEREASLARLIEQQTTPGSPNYHRWLTAQELGSQFGADPLDIEAVTGWLKTNGFTISQVYPSGMVIDFSGTAGQVRAAFHTELHALLVEGVRHIANINDPQIPAALAPAVAGIASLHDFRPHAMHRSLTPQHIDPRSGGLSSDYTYGSGTGAYQAVVPEDLATIYSLTPLFTAGVSGQGQTIAVVEDTNLYSTADWTTFRSRFGLSKYTAGNLVQVHPGLNCANPGASYPDDGEATLDAEWASAAAPSATIELAACANTATTFGGLLALQNLLNGPARLPAVVSVSYGECEAENGAAGNAAYYAAYQQAAAEGVSVFVAAGDEGAASCDAGESEATHGIAVSGLASTPYNVAVGGTDFEDAYLSRASTYWNSTNDAVYGSARSYIPEVPWNDSCAGSLLSAFEGTLPTYGARGFCNTPVGELFLSTVSGSGGPSNCATGAPTIAGVAGGTCRGYAKPSWQASTPTVPSDSVRDIPDVSLFAANGLWGHYYVYCYTDVVGGGSSCAGAPSTWAGAGGTSFSSPILAGFQALVDQYTGSAQGNPNPTYYKLAVLQASLANYNSRCNSNASPSSGCVFYDVTAGDMDVNCTGTNGCYGPSGANGVLSSSKNAYAPAYGANLGFDFATGLGTVNAANLVHDWTRAAP